MRQDAESGRQTLPFRERYLQKTQRRKLAIILIIAFFVLTLVAKALFGESGILVNLEVRREYQYLKAERDRLSAENERLKAEIRALKNNKRKIEALGRKDFGFGREGEIVFYFPEDESEPIQKQEK